MQELRLENILFLDIETVPIKESFGELNGQMKKLWEVRSSHLRKEGEDASDVWSRAGLYAEFGRIICISAGLFSKLSEPRRFRIKSFYGDDEIKIIRDFGGLIRNFRKGKDLILCAHNGKEFDFPFIARRTIILDEPLPEVLNIAGKKPWERNFVDTLELWKFGEFRNYTSLALLAEILGVSNPKDDLDGSQVAPVYYVEKDIDRIARYCEKDVLAVAQVLLRLRGEKLIPEENVEVIENSGSS
ncbi:MAG: ribonuclease H-like domain-containing protein [Bacteroidales bacterium]|nr:ribonuclease H-like domain-containing protein [Bacteroidales bacterium]